MVNNALASRKAKYDHNHVSNTNYSDVGKEEGLHNLCKRPNYDLENSKIWRNQPYTFKLRTSLLRLLKHGEPVGIPRSILGTPLGATVM